MTSEQPDSTDETPLPQQLLDSEWILALAAILYFTVSYVIWGLVDIMSVPGG